MIHGLLLPLPVLATIHHLTALPSRKRKGKERIQTKPLPVDLSASGAPRLSEEDGLDTGHPLKKRKNVLSVKGSVQQVS